MSANVIPIHREIRVYGMTVGELRKALEGVPDDLTVTMRSWDDSEDIACCGLRSAVQEDNCAGPHFVLDGDTGLIAREPEEDDE